MLLYVHVHVCVSQRLYELLYIQTKFYCLMNDKITLVTQHKMRLWAMALG